MPVRAQNAMRHIMTRSKTCEEDSCIVKWMKRRLGTSIDVSITSATMDADNLGTLELCLEPQH